MRLYEINQVFNLLLNDYEDGFIDNEIFEKEINLIDCEFAKKADNLASYIKNLASEELAIKNEINSLTKRKLSKQKALEKIKNYLKKEMEAFGKEKIESSKNKIHIIKNPPSVELDDGFISWAQENADKFLKYRPPEPDKTRIKEEIQNGKEIPYAKIVQTKRIEIK